jgi:uncharacterized repeat protein (TIGR01451 family)
MRLAVRRWRSALVAIATVSCLLKTAVFAATGTAYSNTASDTQATNGNGITINGQSNTVTTSSLPIGPPRHVSACAGGNLPDYTGFAIGLYSTDAQNDLVSPIQLTRTQLPLVTGINLPEGLAPNNQNANPFSLSNGNTGDYEFLLDASRGQTAPGFTFIELVKASASSSLQPREIKIVVGATSGGSTQFTATALDGQPINAGSGSSLTGSTFFGPIAQGGPNWAIFGIDVGICPAAQMRITKTADRASAAPGDTVAYDITVTNLSAQPAGNVSVIDTLPMGFSFLPTSVHAYVGSGAVSTTTAQSGNVVTFTYPGPLASGATLTIAYAVVVTQDATRSDGKNTALVVSTINQVPVRQGPAIYQLTVTPGIMRNCGTVIGRVFVDKNFDGEQETGEPGIPNAVVIFDDGNRVTTDPNGLFHYDCVQPGWHTAVIDLTSVAGYTLAPNVHMLERRSQSRMVHLEPGGLVRLNFALTPTFQGQSR